MIDFFSRLDKYMEYSNLNDNKITVEAGISNGLIGKARKKGGALSLDNISKILYTYSDLSADWLLTGRGEMLNSKQKDDSIINKIVCKSDPRDVELISIQRDLISSLKQQVKDLESKIYSSNMGLDAVRPVDSFNPSQAVEKAKHLNK